MAQASNQALTTAESRPDIASAMAAIGRDAKAAARVLAIAPAEQKNRALSAMAKAIRAGKAAILAANAQDMTDGKAAGLTGSFLDRLELNDKRIEAMAEGLDVIRELADPVGKVTEILDPAERHDHRARARAARRGRRDLREPPRTSRPMPAR